MSNNHHFSDECLNAFVDGELDGAEQEEVLAAIAGNPSLSRDICSLRATKDMVRHAYELPSSIRSHQRRSLFSWHPALAAGIALVVGIAIGWEGHNISNTPEKVQLATRTNDGSLEAVHSTRILIHLDNSSPEHMEEALDLAEAYLAKTGKSNVEVVVNNSGIDMLRAETSPFAARIASLASNNEVLSFIACGHAVARYRKAGKTVSLLPTARTEASAIEHIVKRLGEGWTYVKI